MNAFHRTKKDSRIIGFMGLAIAIFLSMAFMLIGFINIGEDKWNGLQLIFGIAGILLFVVFIRGAWMATSGAVTHVFSVYLDELNWGFLGKEKSLQMKEVHSIYWDESDGFNLALHTSSGRVHLPYAQNVISYNSRPILLSFLRLNYPEIEIEGYIDKKTEQVAASDR